MPNTTPESKEDYLKIARQKFAIANREPQVTADSKRTALINFINAITNARKGLNQNSSKAMEIIDASFTRICNIFNIIILHFFKFTPCVFFSSQ